MSLYQLFISAFKAPQKLIFSVSKKFGKVFVYLLFLSALLSIPIGIQVNKVIKVAQRDLTTISEKIPEFTIQDNKLSAPDSEGFIQQTDNFIFTFDPKGVYQPKDVQDDLIGNAVGLALLSDQALLTVPEDHLMAGMLPKTLFSLKYEAFDTSSFNKAWITHQLGDNSQSRVIQFFAYIAAIIPMFINLLMSLFMMSLIGNIWCRMTGSPLRLSETFKIITFSATVPVVISTVLAIFQPGIDQMFIIMFLTFLIYLRVISPTIQKPKLK
ncbi:DUF1189 domain-containing protein [Vagococcus coleopterorum]|uniref:DUF1189 domain-containing protein n=1 Tax=Vagococcus coleopterorum TaxID=2714946 RepID=A0A6G8AN29_9ENTE|nr:DUF1189 domain-containing protein [Vagococcus coleopterorum]QIL46333.1 DUF1189 domain-containing protein [Vagococcus coleopterorum]